MTPHPRLDAWEDLPLWAVHVERYDEDLFMAEVDGEGAQAFLDSNPDFYPCEWNRDLMLLWLDGRPTTRHNLEIAYGQLRELLAIPPPEEQAPERVRESRFDFARRAAEGRIATAPATPDERAALEKLKDDPNLSDQQRKVRFKRLQMLAHQSRYPQPEGVEFSRDDGRPFSAAAKDLARSLVRKRYGVARHVAYDDVAALVGTKMADALKLDQDERGIPL